MRKSNSQSMTGRKRRAAVPFPPHVKIAAAAERAGVILPFRRPTRKVGRNEPCLCGSGRKYKKCCLDKPAAPLAA